MSILRNIVESTFPETTLSNKYSTEWNARKKKNRKEQKKGIKMTMRRRHKRKEGIYKQLQEDK